MVVTSPAENSTMLGVNLTSSTGVHIHNVPLRGNSGTLFDDVREEDWSTFKMLHNVGLVILQFGGNAVPSLGGEEAAKRYAKAIATNIRHIQGQMPGVPIVFIGPSDMGASPSDFPGLSAVVDALRDAVLSSDALFWDLQAVMGGPGSMATWMNTGLAGNDGIHFTPQGARLVGERLDAVLRQAGRNRVNTSREP
jgi:lysophospholipase L1-like esterase